MVVGNVPRDIKTVGLGRNLSKTPVIYGKFSQTWPLEAIDNLSFGRHFQKQHKKEDWHKVCIRLETKSCRILPLS